MGRNSNRMVFTLPLRFGNTYLSPISNNVLWGRLDFTLNLSLKSSTFLGILTFISLYRGSKPWSATANKYNQTISRIKWISHACSIHFLLSLNPLSHNLPKTGQGFWLHGNRCRLINMPEVVASLEKSTV